MSDPNPTLSSLPNEIIIQILKHLDIADLLPLTRTSHHLRSLSLDPLLHSYRLHRASLALNHYMPMRPSLTSLMHQRIYITRTTLAARHLGRNLIKIKLNRKLLGRPSAETLVEKGVLPSECYAKGKGGYLAPSLVETKRKVEKERVKDVLRHWVEEWRTKGWESREEAGWEKPNVRRIARRFARSGTNVERERQKWGRAASEDLREMPTRAKVLGLRRFWEKIGREGVGPSAGNGSRA
ncbi:hypothetical protein D0Z07_1962 [Hyphodiscus hymeniophilus]|uniref:F-box domain-containing protein n=1 Tax=Hyphodiscus hymeniophilus TaxID=353542 RepID=A0A9P7B022_9HELO|nr:hypothetical protein D0Z07_1962 [Hyphodiscus hymeniophilus]